MKWIEKLFKLQKNMNKLKNCSLHKINQTKEKERKIKIKFNRWNKLSQNLNKKMDCFK